MNEKNIKHQSTWTHVLMSRSLWLTPACFSLFLILLAQHSFLAFHTLAELFAIIVSFVMFAIAWTTRKFTANNFLLFLACGYLFIGIIDLLHAMTYKGMNIFSLSEENFYIKSWLAARFFEALILCLAPLASFRKFDGTSLLVCLGLASLIVPLFIVTGNFPTVFVEGQGLSDFKVNSEYLIIGILVMALVSLFKFASLVSHRDKVLIGCSIIFTILAELAFTFYVSTYGLSNLVGHIFKLFSFWFIFNSIAVSNLQKPYEILKQSEARFKRLFENVDVAIWNVNFSALYQELQVVRDSGVEDLKTYLENNPCLVQTLAEKVALGEVNEVTLVLFDAPSKQRFKQGIRHILGTNATEVFTGLLCAIWNGDKLFRSEISFFTLKGVAIHTIVSFNLPHNEDDYKNVPVSIFDITKQKQVEKQLLYQANYDELTGLANRKCFTECLSSTISTAEMKQRPVAVLLIDLDRFKTVNETLGHSLGDRLLCEVSTRIKHLLKPSDVLARLGGDEFIIMLSEHNKLTEVKYVVMDMLDSLSQPYVISEHDAFISASIGISVFPQDGVTAETLLQRADSAMYLAKDKGRNNFQFFSEEINASSQRKLLLEKELRKAITNKEFSLNYQAIFDVQTDDLQAAPEKGQTESISSVEALIRWNHPQRGFIPPLEFISLAENIGLILPIGEWVLRQACYDAMSWAEICEGPPSVSVNLSSVQFQRQDMPALIKQVLLETALPADRLVLEITEGLLLADDDLTLNQLQTIQSMGIKLSIDDFGTGYSSLSYLKKFPVSTLKIDRSFIMNLPNNSEEVGLVNAMLLMANSLNLNVVAEGVETEAQATFLKQHGCQYIQGYLYSKPLSKSEFIEFLKKNVEKGQARRKA